MPAERPQLYDQDYRHFDTLIWQAPTWASAVFTFTMTTAGLLLTNLEKVSLALKLDPLPTLSVFLLAVFVVLMLLANALVRFRLHQGALPAPAIVVRRPWWQPRGHTSLLLVIFIESAVLLSFGLYCAGLPIQASNAAAIALLVVLFPILELWVLNTIELQRHQAQSSGATSQPTH
ncbi:hypothetical protein [Paucibacter sp. B51]|uniref:hypothetical protein n=1 Tax=Paucibacter sp. B51 TaxID=2993315 RepID=UPI0022EBBE45|nr:hypothetical protein [Paucibacter sp. B51]